MKFLFLLIIFALSILAQSKIVKKTIKLANFNKEGPFIFVTKFHIGAGHGKIDIRYTKGDQIISQSFYNNFSIGVINFTTMPIFANTSKCQDKEKLLYSKQKFNLKQQKFGMKRLSLFNLGQEDLWYFYVFSCSDNTGLTNSKEQIVLQASVFNNDSHFGQNQQTLYGYVIIFIVWGILMVRFAFPMTTLLSFKKPNGSKLTIFGGLVMLGAAYLYRLIHLVLYKIDGSGIYTFQIFYIVLKNAAQAIITTMIVSFSWGWSIMHLRSNQNYIIIGFIVGIVSLILSLLTQEHEQLFHHFQTIPGTIILILRVIIFIVFMTGIISSLKACSGTTVHFIKKLALIGGSYLLSWPVTVLFVELTFPNYMHKEIITFIEQAVHICACTLLCSMISSPQSAYRKVSLQQDDNPLGIKNYRSN